MKVETGKDPPLLLSSLGRCTYQVVHIIFPIRKSLTRSGHNQLIVELHVLYMISFPLASPLPRLPTPLPPRLPASLLLLLVTQLYPIPAPPWSIPTGPGDLSSLVTPKPEPQPHLGHSPFPCIPLLPSYSANVDVGVQE